MIAVSGAAGYIGSLLVHRLREAHPHEAVMGFDVMEGADHELDAREEGPMDGVAAEASVFYHLAAVSGVEACREDPGAAIRNNIEATATVARSCAAHGTRMVFVTSQAAWTPTLYGRTKLTSEDLLWETPGLEWVALRFPNVYGEHHGRTKGTVVDAFMERASAGDPLPVHKPGTQRRNFLHVRDAVDALLAAHSRGEEVVPIGGEETMAINNLAGLVAEEHGVGVEMVDVERDVGAGVEPDVDLSLARDRLGWSPSRSVVEYVRG